jgi:hypothetical protein
VTLSPRDLAALSVAAWCEEQPARFVTGKMVDVEACNHLTELGLLERHVLREDAGHVIWFITEAGKRALTKCIREGN